MVMLDTEAEPQFTQPIRQIASMIFVLSLVIVGASIIYPSLAPVFWTNPFLNGLILGVFVIGLLACFWQMLQLISSVKWIEAYLLDAPGQMETDAPRLLATLAALLRSRNRFVQLSSASTRSILDSVGTRIDEARDITRYLVSLLIFLGLLGTFYGLATTVPAVVDTIRSLAPQEGDQGVEVFSRLLTGLESQLGGMGTAFASSLLGLAGSLIVGLLELFASHGQNRFYRELEDWLSSITRIGFAGVDSDGGGEATSATAMVDYMGQQMEAMHQMFVQAESRRALVDEKLGQMVEAVSDLTSRIEKEHGVAEGLERLAQTQERVADVLGAQSGVSYGGEETDAEARMRLRSIDVQMLRILEELSAGRQESMSELRGDLAALTREIQKMRGVPV